MKRLLSLLAYIFILTSCVNPAYAQKSLATSRQSNKQFIQYLSDRSVIIVNICNPKDHGRYLISPKPIKSRGSGVIVTSKKEGSYIFTAAHVVDNPNKSGLICTAYVKKNTANKNIDEYLERAAVIIFDSNKDAAILKVSSNYGIRSFLELHPFAGENVWHVGFPTQIGAKSKLLLSATKGTLATLGVYHKDPEKYGKYIRVTAELYKGSSGGGVWTVEGKLVSITSYLMTNKGAPLPGEYYTIPVATFRDLVIEHDMLYDIF